MGEQKYHHKIPKTYMKSWCFSGDSVWVYEKQSKKSKVRNISSIMGENFFYSLKAGSIFTTSKALDIIFDSLSGLTIYDVQNDGKLILLENKEEYNAHFYNFSNWLIQDKSGKNITKKQRNIIFTNISQACDNSIEECWSQKYESRWANYIFEIYHRVLDIKNQELVTLTDEDAHMIMDYFIMFQWRGGQGFDLVKKTFDKIMEYFIDVKDEKTKESYNRNVKTVSDELWHNLQLETYNKYFNNEGFMKLQREMYFQDLTFLFLVDVKERLITSDNPCFTFINHNGYQEPILVALPGLIISLAKKDNNSPDAYKILMMGDDDVKYYNRIIYDNACLIVSKIELVELDCSPLTED